MAAASAPSPFDHHYPHHHLSPPDHHHHQQQQQRTGGSHGPLRTIPPSTCRTRAVCCISLSPPPEPRVGREGRNERGAVDVASPPATAAEGTGLSASYPLMLLSNLVTTVRHARARISGSECSSRATRSLDSILCLGARDYSSGSAGGGPGMRGELAFTSAKPRRTPTVPSKKKREHGRVCMCV